MGMQHVWIPASKELTHPDPPEKVTNNRQVHFCRKIIHRDILPGLNQRGVCDKDERVAAAHHPGEPSPGMGAVGICDKTELHSSSQRSFLASINCESFVKRANDPIYRKGKKSILQASSLRRSGASSGRLLQNSGTGIWSPKNL